MGSQSFKQYDRQQDDFVKGDWRSGGGYQDSGPSRGGYGRGQGGYIASDRDSYSEKSSSMAYSTPGSSA